MAGWTRWRRNPAADWIKKAMTVFLMAMVLNACATEPEPKPTTPGTLPKSQTRPKPYRVGKYWYHPLPDARDFKERGIASWYGPDFHGKKTSSGEIYDMHAMTAAHKTLPLGVFVRVTHLKNNKSIEVRINDRGPFVKDRIIDLSYAAAKKLDIVGPGTGPVEVVALGAPLISEDGAAKPGYAKVDFFSGQFTFQVGAFSDRDNARRLEEKLNQTFDNVHIVPYNSGRQFYYRVRVGKCTNLDDAEAFEQKLISYGYPGAFIVAE